MNTDEWKRNELFHLLLEKFGLKLNEGFEVTGGGEEWDPEGYQAPEPVVDPFPDQKANVEAWKSDFEAPTTAQLPSISGDTEYRTSLPFPKSSPNEDQVKKLWQQSKSSLKWDPNLNIKKQYSSKDTNFNQEIESFKSAISGRESGGLGYKAVGIPVYRNDGTLKGVARGKYQIMDYNWKNWSAEAGLPPQAQDPDIGMTPENQEYVATFKFHQYHKKFGGDWRKVGIAWYSGPGNMEAKSKDYSKVSHHAWKDPFPSRAEYGDDIRKRMSPSKTKT